ncbi:Putative inner membrane protein [Helicobacter mustelae 12198]|uniref:Putative inner membrane protein n=1 Tax=Helicobacter mustelae (strain ATCC 43772 / CCUG 25715 / CIP 103759 / LMG 18044 / NCTC 12198 / R85-136P) TaxID=679897 RepID=D3UG01_HELM1|nr:Putative inner membrane protein [Helicobacter mustelae 12198]
MEFEGILAGLSRHCLAEFYRRAFVVFALILMGFWLIFVWWEMCKILKTFKTGLMGIFDFFGKILAFHPQNKRHPIKITIPARKQGFFFWMAS